MDELAREYLVLGLAAGRLQDGIVDAFYGPRELRAAAEAASLSATDLATRAAGLRERVLGEESGQRAGWLAAQLLALETIARQLAGEQFDYSEEVERCFETRPLKAPAARYAEVRAQLETLLPPGSTLHARLEARNRGLEIPRERLAEAVDFTLDEIARRCQQVFPLPDGESLTVSLVTGEPWAAYNWYDGDLRSRIEINTDLPAHATTLIGLLCHEAYPGHHLEHAWKEQRLVREQGRIEASIQLINTPEAFISEGLAEVGQRFVLDDDERLELFLALCSRSGIDMAPQRAQDELVVNQTLRELSAASADAALMLHAERRPVSEVREFLEGEALRTPEQADKDLAFIGHPLWRAYVFCYAGGEALLQQWCTAAGDPAAQRARFFRLLTEQLTPAAIAAELTPAA